MKALTFLKEHRDAIVSYCLNIAGTLLILAGLVTLPVYVSYKLLLVGVYFLVLWYTYNKK